MSYVPSIDKIAVTEERTRMARRQDLITKGIDASAALLWFKEYAVDRPAADVLKVMASPIASATPQVDLARKYLDRAAAQFADDIISTAIGIANQEFAVAKEAAR